VSPQHAMESTTADAALAPAPLAPKNKVRTGRRSHGPRALEAEADGIVDALVAGHTGLARRATPTRASHAHLPASTGTPLTGTARRRLEDGLGVDLSRLRIHDDAAAHAAAASEGARAFTAGPAVFFASREYAPHTEAGFHLLAHEVVHAVQQTGRASLRGGMRVTDVSGEGPLQADDAEWTEIRGLDPGARFEAISARHAGAEGTPAPAWLVPRMRARLGGLVDPESAAYRALVADVVGGDFDEHSVAARSYLFDLMKAGNSWSAAAHLLDHSAGGLWTLSRSDTFATWLSEHRNEAWYRRAVARDPGMTNYRDAIYEQWRRFFMYPGSEVTDVPAESDWPRVLGEATWGDSLTRDERTAAATITLASVDQLRKQLCARIDAATTDPRTLTDDPLVLQHRNNDVERAWRRSMSSPAGVELVLNRLPTADGIQGFALRWFLRISRVAQEFWTAQVLQAVEQLAARGALSRFAVSAQARRASALPSAMRRQMGPTVNAVSTQAMSFLNADVSTFPSPATYRRRVALLGRGIDAAIARARLSLGNYRLRADAGRARAQADVAALVRLERLKVVVDAYTDEAREADLRGAREFDDTRRGHRLRVAAELHVLGVELVSSRLEAAAQRVLANDGARESRLILVGDWVDEQRVDPLRLVEDFPRGLRGPGGLMYSSTAIARLYQLEVLTRLETRLAELLDGPQAADADAQVLGPSFTHALARTTPTRYSVDEVEWAPSPDERRQAMDLVATHPKTVAQLPANDLMDTNVFWGTQTADLENTPSPPLVIAWRLPNYAAVERRMADALAAARIEFPGPHVEGATPLERLSATADALEESSPIALRARAIFAARASEDYDAAAARLGIGGDPAGLLRRGANHDRVVVSGRVGTLLDAYAVHHNFLAPTDALSLIESFHRHAAPAEDNVAQLAALMIDIAPQLRGAFTREYWFGITVTADRYDIVTGYYGLILVAVRWLESAERRRELIGGFLDPTAAGQLQDRGDDLRALLAAFETVRARVQTSQGFEGHQGGNLRSLNYVFEVTPEHRFGADRVSVYQLVRVHQSFVFHPAYGRRGVTIDGVDMGARRDATVADGNGNAISGETLLMTIIVNGNEERIQADQLDELDRIWRAVEDKAFQLSMENLAEAIDDSVELMLTAAEFVPGAGQVLAAGRIVMSVTTFLMSADFEEIKAALTGEAQARIEAVLNDITSFRPEDLWMFLMFEANMDVLDRLRQPRPGTTARPARRRTGKLARVLHILASVGAMMAEQFDRVQDAVQPPLRRTQSFVNTHPIVAMILQFAADTIRSGTNVAQAIEDLTNVRASFEQRIRDMVDAVRTFEVPEEIVPLPVAVDAILSFVLSRLGAKGRAARVLLELTGMNVVVSERIAAAIDEAGGNPNDYWMEHAQPAVSDMLTQARAEFLAELQRGLALIGYGDLVSPDTERVEAGASAAPSVDDGAAAPALSPGHTPADLDGVGVEGGDIIPPGPGAPLDSATRTRVETRFGAPLGHVRVHRADIGRGIDAVTRGSHIVVRPGLSLGSRRGEHVLTHEVAHVMQQSRGRATESRGKPGRRLAWNAAAESQAESLASGAGIPSSFLALSDDEGVPAFSAATLAGVFDRLSSYSDLEAFQHHVEDTPLSGPRSFPTLTPEQTNAVTRVRDRLRAALTDPRLDLSAALGRRAPGARGDEIDAAVRRHIRERSLTIVEERAVLTRLARSVLREIHRSRRAAAAAGPDAPTHHLYPGDLAAAIEGYLLVRGGVNVAIDLGRTREQLADATALASHFRLRVHGVFLGGVSRNSFLWTYIRDHQFSFSPRQTLRGTYRTVDDGDGNPVHTRHSFVLDSARAQDTIMRAVMTHVRAFGPRERALHARDFRIREGIVRQVVDALAVSTGITPADLPNATEYTRTSVRPGETGIGLRVGTHAQLTGLHAPGRHSHHTTQFLFAQYFSQQGSSGARLPFSSTTPGLEWSGDRATALHRESGHPLNFDAIYGAEGSRGGPMPAILLAAATHQGGDLHMPYERPTGSAGTSSQRNTVANWYFTASRAPQGSRLTGSRSSSAAIASITVSAATRQANAAAVRGVETAYRDMRLMMLTRLASALASEERAYYTNLAVQRAGALGADGELTSAWDLTPSRLTRVRNQADDNNDTVMTGYGFEDGA